MVSQVSNANLLAETSGGVTLEDTQDQKDIPSDAWVVTPQPWVTWISRLKKYAMQCCV